MNNINEARNLETKIKKLVNTLQINTVYNNHIEIFKVENNNLQNLITKIDDISLNITIKNKHKIVNNLVNNLELFR